MHKVLITGITGFLGSHIAEALIQKGIKVIGLKRSTSDIWRCEDFSQEVDWIDIDDFGNWKQIIIEKGPSEVIHCAWIGVEAKERDNWSIQAKNINFLLELFEVAQSLALNKFIFVGSQAEYGNISGKITEEEVPNALNAYSGTKLACLELLKAFCESHRISWIWLRLFSVFGEKENANWLIPSMINMMLNEKEMDFTKGDQKYAYLYVKDFAEIVKNIVSTKINSGIYNISSEEARPIRSVIEIIRNRVNPKFKLNFGVLPYRPYQSMHMEGDISKLVNQIGKPEFTNFNKALQQTVSYFMQK